MHGESQDSVEEILSTVRGGAKRVTVAKRTVAEVLVGASGHLTVDEVTVAVQDRRPDVSPSTVYRILEEFEELKIVVHTHLGQSAAVYHLSGAVHGHLTCEVCNYTMQIPAAHLTSWARTCRRPTDSCWTVTTWPSRARARTVNQLADATYSEHTTPS